MVSAGHVGGTPGSGIVSSAADVLWMRGVGGVCDMCMFCKFILPVCGVLDQS